MKKVENFYLLFKNFVHYRVYKIEKVIKLSKVLWKTFGQNWLSEFVSDWFWSRLDNKIRKNAGAFSGPRDFEETRSCEHAKWMPSK